MARKDEVARLDGLAELARTWRRPDDSDSLAGLVGYCRLLLDWGAHINLTGAKTFAALVGDHLPDAFAAASIVAPGELVLDVGSGGGLPALPFAVLRPDCAVTLTEPTAKKVAFLRTAVRELGLRGVSVHAARVGDRAVPTLRPDGPDFDLAMSRATFPIARWLAIGGRLVRPGGRVLAFAGSRGERGSKGPPPVDLEASGELEYRTPQSGRRVLLTYTRLTADDVSRGTIR